MGEWGEGGPVIAFLGEYDALPGLSQEAGIAEPRPVEAGGQAMAAVTTCSVRRDARRHRAQGLARRERGAGRVRYYGCPAEEGGAAKAFMVRAGVFEDADIAISWHPASTWRRRRRSPTPAPTSFTGRASHAAASPHLGRSALDAVELTNVGVNYMREHMPSDARVHYAMLDTGGIAPNVVQAHAPRALFDPGPRPPRHARTHRVRGKIARGRGVDDRDQGRDEVICAVSNTLPNTPLEQALFENMERLGPPLRRCGPSLRRTDPGTLPRRTSFESIAASASSRARPLVIS